MSQKPSDKLEKLFSLFKQAITDEQGAQKLYMEMLKNTDDPDLKIILLEFIQQEQGHEKTLVRRYNALRKSGKFEG